MIERMTTVADPATYDKAVQRFREARILLPTFAQMADPTMVKPEVRGSVAGVDPDAADAHNLFRKQSVVEEPVMAHKLTAAAFATLADEGAAYLK